MLDRRNRKRGNRTGMRDCVWRDPDSNRGHHDFQSPWIAMSSGQKALQIAAIEVFGSRTSLSRSLRSFRA
jgi:hypothetical protein